MNGSSSSALMASPKSPSLNFMDAVRNMFSGLMSLCTSYQIMMLQQLQCMQIGKVQVLLQGDSDRSMSRKPHRERCTAQPGGRSIDFVLGARADLWIIVSLCNLASMVRSGAIICIAR